MHELATRAELEKLATALGTGVERVGFARGLAPAEIRRLREQVVAALYDEHRAEFHRVAAITRLLPTPLNVRIALRGFSPMLAARVAGEMAPERAAELANRMPVEYLAQACVHLDPRRAGPVIRRIDPDRAFAVVAELVRREEFVTLGRLLDVAPTWIVRDVAERVQDEAMLRIGYYAESAAQLTSCIEVLPAQRLRGIVRTALSGPPDLRSTALTLIDRVADDRLRTRLAGYAAETGTDHLTALLATAVTEGALPELARAVAAMPEPVRARVLAMPAPTRHDTLADLLRAVSR